MHTSVGSGALPGKEDIALIVLAQPGSPHSPSPCHFIFLTQLYVFDIFVPYGIHDTLFGAISMMNIKIQNGDLLNTYRTRKK